MLQRSYVGTVPGKHVHVSFYKPQGRPALVTAQEGRFYLEGREFVTEPFGGDRIVREPLCGKNTPNNRAAALLRLHAKLEADGLIVPGQQPIVF